MKMLFEFPFRVLPAILLAAAFPLASNARYDDDYEGHYEDLNCAEDDCDCLEPDNNRFKVVSPVNTENTGATVVYTGAYYQVQALFDARGWTDGLSIVPPTTIKVEKFMRYATSADHEPIVTLNGRGVTPYQIAVNAVMSGCTADLLPICTAFVKAMADEEYLREISDGTRVPLAFLNGPVARQVGVDHGQGMTTEEVNICLSRFIELAMINLAGIPHNRGGTFGTVQALVLAEDDEACLAAGWQPYHVQQGYRLNDNTVTMTSFNMWGNNSTPATDIPEEIMKLIAWDVTEKNIGGLGAADTATYAGTRRTLLITPPVAAVLGSYYRTKESLSEAVAENARRPMAMRAFACCYSDTGGVLSSGKTYDEVYDALVAAEEEDARVTDAPPWIDGITNPRIMTGAVMKGGNMRIFVTGDASRNKTQVMPGGKSVTVALELPARWTELLKDLQRKDLAEYVLEEPAEEPVLSAPFTVPAVLADGTYRIIHTLLNSDKITVQGTLHLEAGTNELEYYPVGGSASAKIELDPVEHAGFIKYVLNLSNNSSFVVANGAIKETIVRFSQIAKDLDADISGLTARAFPGKITLNPNYSKKTTYVSYGPFPAQSGAVLRMSETVTSFSLNLNATPILEGDTTWPGFVTVSGQQVTMDPDAPAGAKATIGAANADGSYRTLTFVKNSNGTCDVTYYREDTLSSGASIYHLVWDDGEAAFEKTGAKDVFSLTRRLEAGDYSIRVTATNTTYASETAIADYCDRVPLAARASCPLHLSESGYYTFNYYAGSRKLSIARDLTKEGICTGGKVENIGGVYVIHPDSVAAPVALENLKDDPRFEVVVNGAKIPGAAFEGLAEGTTEGEFSLMLKPPVLDGVQAGDGADGFSVSVETFENLRYVLKRATDLDGTFVPVNAKDAETIGTGKPVKLIDASLDRPPNRAFYRVGVSIPIQ